MKAIKLTVDGELMTEQPPGIPTLKQWEDEGKIKITQAFHAAAPAKKAPGAHSWPGSSKTSQPSPNMPGRHRKIPPSGTAKQFNSLASVVFPGKSPMQLGINEINDVAHLLKHKGTGNSYFVTTNSHLVDQSRKRVLAGTFGIVTLTPVELVEIMCKEHGWEATEKV